MRSRILIYRDYGCADVSDLYAALENFYTGRGISVEMTDASAVLKDNALNDGVLAFFMPGGAATPYRMKLGCQGNAKIRSYVENGGVYFGLCAGAYYASRRCRFEEDVPELAVVEDYGLDLIDADAVGTLKKDFKINHYSPNPSSSTVTEVIWLADGEKHAVFYHGGPKFELRNLQNHEVLASYAEVDGTPPAVVMRRLGRGLAVVSGVHFEDGVDSLRSFVGRTIEDRLQAEALSRRMAEGEEGRKRLLCKLMAKLGGR